MAASDEGAVFAVVAPVLVAVASGLVAVGGLALASVDAVPDEVGASALVYGPLGGIVVWREVQASRREERAAREREELDRRHAVEREVAWKAVASLRESVAELSRAVHAVEVTLRERGR